MTYTLTTPLYYVNDRAHLGSTYTTLACDSIARFRRLQGERVTFITGCDEHGLKIQRSAEAAGLTPRPTATPSAASTATCGAAGASATTASSAPPTRATGRSSSSSSPGSRPAAM